MSRADILSVVETIYDLSLNSEQFNQVFHERVEALLPATHAAVVYSAHLGDAGEVLISRVSCHDERVADALRSSWRYVPREDGTLEVTNPLQRWLFKSNFETLCGGGFLGSATLRGLPLRTACVDMPNTADLFFLSERPRLTQTPGVIVAASRVVLEPLAPKTEQRWQRVRAHLAAAVRLRQAFEARQLDLREPSEHGAVLSADGRLLHADGEATISGAQEALRRAAQEVDRARLNKNGRGDDALALWKGMVRGEWSLVERFDADGRRYYVAHKNEENYRDPRGLSEQEARVSACVARGFGNALTAYTLGISEATVATHLSAAIRKLGCRDRAHFIRELGMRYPRAQRKGLLSHLVFKKPRIED